MVLSVRNAIRSALLFSRPDAIKIVIDLILITAAAFWAWFVSFGQLPNPGSPLPFLAVAVGARTIIYFVMRLHRMSWLHVSRYELLWLLVSAAVGPLAIAILIGILPVPFSLRTLVRPDLILVTEPALYLLLLCGARISARAAYSNQPADGKRQRVLIVGAGAAGRALAFQIQEEGSYEIAGMVDDHPRRQGRRVRGVRVLGTTSELTRIARDLQVQEIIIAIPSLQPERLREMLAVCEETQIPVRIVPPLRELMSGKFGGKVDTMALREVRMEDLLPRAEVQLDHDSIAAYLRGKCVMVTGGGGSIGGELCRQAVAGGAVRLLVLGRGENSVFEMTQELRELDSECEIIPVICDIRDQGGLARVFERYGPQVVFHAAAHKHVPLMEQYPSEAVKNNVLGTFNVVELSIQKKVESFVMVSTDKAVEPSSVMGATKHICEMVVKAYAIQAQTNMVSVRFGNVLGSRGSVVPTMRRQILRRLPVTITDPEMVRFFMTIPEAVQLILQAGATGGCGEVFVLDMGRPVKILDLAYDLIHLSGLVPHRDIPVKIIGRRPGEKMHEDILTTEEISRAKKNGPFYMVASQQVALEEMKVHVKSLRSLSDQGDDEGILRVIQALVPGFRSAATNLDAPAPRHVDSLMASVKVQPELVPGSQGSPLI